MMLGIMALEPDEPSMSVSEGTVVVPDDSAFTNALDLTKSDHNMAVMESLPCDSSKGESISKETVTEPLE